MKSLTEILLPPSASSVSVDRPGRASTKTLRKISLNDLLTFESNIKQDTPMGDRIVHQKTSVVDFDSDASLIQAMKRTKRPRENECTPCEKKIRSLTKTVSKAPFDSAVCDWKLAIAQKTSNPQTLEAEVGRLLALKSYGVIDADREPIFERITAFASRTFEVPIALVSLVDLGRQWFMSNR